MTAKQPNRRTTIYQVAERAGVSSSTVSRALNGVSKEKSQGSASRAQRIRQIAEQMGYQPNWRARVFAEGKTRSVGLLQPSEDTMFKGVNTQIAAGFVSELYKHKYHVVLMPIGEDQEWQQTFDEQRVDGYAIMQQLDEVEDVCEAIVRHDSPAVLINNTENRNYLPRVLIDDYAGMQLAIRHLTLLGHSQIGLHLGTHSLGHYSVQERLRGFQEAMGFKSGDDSMIWREDDQSIMRHLGRGGSNRPTAVICYSHQEAIPLLYTLSQFGIKVPQDMSVISFNDIEFSEYLNPPLTTMAYDADRVGRVSAQLLLRQINENVDGMERETVTLKQHLIVRGSTGPVPQS